MAKITVSFMRELETMLRNELITYSRMVELLNEKAVEAETLWASGFVSCNLCGHEWVAVRRAESNVLECPKCNNLASFTTPEEL